MDVNRRTVAIVGAGLIGRAWASGLCTRRLERASAMTSVSAQLAAARDLIKQALAEQEQAGMLVDAARGARAHRRSATALDDALANASWVQENLPEDVGVKRSVFTDSTRLAPARCHTRQLHVGDRCVAVHCRSCRTRALPGGASGQSAASGAGRRVVRRALDQRSHARSRASDDGMHVGSGARPCAA